MNDYIVQIVLPSRPMQFGYTHVDDEILAEYAIVAPTSRDALRGGVERARVSGIEPPFHVRVHLSPCPDCVPGKKYRLS